MVGDILKMLGFVVAFSVCELLCAVAVCLALALAVPYLFAYEARRKYRLARGVRRAA